MALAIGHDRVELYERHTQAENRTGIRFGCLLPRGPTGEQQERKDATEQRTRHRLPPSLKKMGSG